MKLPTLVATGLSVILATLFTLTLTAHADADHPIAYQKRDLEGWTLLINERLLGSHPTQTAEAIRLLTVQLQVLGKTLPSPALQKLRQVKLFFNLPYEKAAPRAEYHPDRGWLETHGRDPEMTRSVEFTNILIFSDESRRMPILALHELAHAYHHQVLGHEHSQILALFQAAKASRKYDLVGCWTGKTHVKKRAYALSNAKEYFAETSEAFFGKNDFQPFDNQELRSMDPTMHSLLGQLWNNP